jgi:predicted dehydrogenase
MPRRIRWGVVATGNIAGVFTKDLEHLPDHEVVAVGSRSKRRAERFAQRWRVPHAYGSYQEVADDPDVDVVYVATPHSDHLQTTRYALEQGKAVLCEKAFTVNAREAEELIALARAKNTFLMEAMWMRTNPLHLRLKDLVNSGDLGEPRQVKAELGFVAEYDPKARLFAPELAGGALLDVGVYPIAFAYHLLGAPATVHATASKAPTGVDTTVGVLLGYDSGAVATCVGSLDATLPGQATFAGTEGWVELDRSFHDTNRFVVHRPGKDPEPVAVELLGVGYTYEALEVARCLDAGLIESPLVTHADTLAVMEVMDAVREQTGVRYPNDEVVR